MLLSSFLVAAVPASAGTMSWTAFSPVPTTNSQVLAEIDILDIAVSADGDTIYVASGDSTIYKSWDRGMTWSTYDTTDDVDLVAVAPDDDDIVAYADQSDDEVWVSTNGGSTFGTLGVPQDPGDAVVSSIMDLSISPASSGINYVAVAGEEAGPIANVWWYDVGDASPVWTEINSKAGFTTDETGNSTAAAVEFSPNFPSDQVMLALTGQWDGAGLADNISLEIYSFNQSKANLEAGFDSYPVLVTSDTGITDIDAGSLTLDQDYLGSDDSMRLAFIGLDLAGDEDMNGIHRADNTATKELKVGDTIDIKSVAFNGSVLVAGHNDNNVVRYSLDPTASTPTIKTTHSLKRPGFATNDGTIVKWAGTDDIIAGGSGDESAFALSTNNAVSFNDISLIDTVFDDIGGVAVSTDNSRLYMTTDATTGTYGSVWSYTGHWERVLVVDDEGLLVRVAPDDMDVVYVADANDTDMWYSADGGTERWQARTSRYQVQDLAVEGDGTVTYVMRASNGFVSKSTNAGFTWGKEKDAKLNTGV